MSRRLFSVVSCGLLALALGIAVAPRAHAAAIDDAIATVEDHASSGDDLGVRILVKRMKPSDFSSEQWRRVRNVLQSRPGVGWDLVRAWDRTSRAGPPTALDAEVAQGDRLMLEKKFEAAFERYQRAAQSLRRGLSAEFSPNKLLYHSVLQSMGMALYGAGRFDEAEKVLSWIPPLYPNFRQVLFQRMWAGFRGERIDLALGAIASQYSSYFASWVDPETYLVQIYVYRKLCRSDDLKTARASAQRFHSGLKSGSFGYRDWARGEMETIALLNLIERGTNVTSSTVDAEARAAERRRIEATLRRRFKEERVGLLARMEKVMAYVNLAVSSSGKDLSAVRAIPTTSELIRSNRESWPVEDAEDWIDELGNHVFGGGSLCRDGQ